MYKNNAGPDKKCVKENTTSADLLILCVHVFPSSCMCIYKCGMRAKLIHNSEQQPSVYSHNKNNITAVADTMTRGVTTDSTIITASPVTISQSVICVCYTIHPYHYHCRYYCHYYQENLYYTV